MLTAMRIVLATLHSKYIHPSLALPYLAAYCADLTCEIEIREFTLHEPKENILAMLLAGSPDVIALSVYLWNRHETLELVDALAVARPQLKIVLGGPEVSFEDHGLFHSHPGLTALVRGEGELPFRGLLDAWLNDTHPRSVARLAWRDGDQVIEGPGESPLQDLDTIPSPFAAGLVDLKRGFTYLETSRGCPYRCSFCMSSRDQQVRSFSMTRIYRDLRLLMEAQVPKIKLVDRTFNYDATRAREIFAYILAHNQGSHFHFEIGAHLLDAETLELLTRVPADTFQFEIGVQSTLDETLDTIERRVDMARLEQNVSTLRQNTSIHLHLDLIAGLPGENYPQLLHSLDRVIALNPHHLQLEAVKLLPGAPLRESADQHGILFDPHPPYTVLGTPQITFSELQSTRALSRLLDLSWNHGRMRPFLTELATHCGSFSQGLDRLANRLETNGALRHPLAQRGLFETLALALDEEFGAEASQLKERLARDYALSERVSPNNPPAFFDTRLTEAEKIKVRDHVALELAEIRGKGIKLQHFACIFHTRQATGRRLHLYLYLTRSGTGLTVKEIPL